VPAGVLATVTVISLVLRVRSPMWLLSDLGFDDALMARLAGEGGTPSSPALVGP
jgi:hypothetical protein